MAEEHFQPFPFYFFLYFLKKKSFPRVSSGGGKQRGKREVRITPPPKKTPFAASLRGWVPRGHGDKPKAPNSRSNTFFGGEIPHFFSVDPQHRSLPTPGIPKGIPRGQAAGWRCHPPVSVEMLQKPPKLLSAAILVLVEFSCYFILFFFFLLGGGWGGNRGRGAEHRAGLNFSLMCLAEELTVRNTTGFHRKENTVRYLNISRLHHQHRSQLWR